MRRNHKLLVIIFTVTFALSGLTAVGQSQNIAPFQKQFISLWDETLTQLVPVRWGSISPSEVNAMIVAGVPFFLLDVRTTAEFQAERIAGAVNIPIDQLPARLHELPADREAPIVVYCKVGHRGALGFSLIRQWGYVNVRGMVGGIDAWKAARFPTDTTPVTVTPPQPQTRVLPPCDKQFLTLWDDMLTQVKPVRWGSITIAETNAMLLGNVPFLALDVRTPAEFATGRIPGAVNIPLDQLPSRLRELPADPETIIVVYCKAGHRSVMGFALLRQFGYVNVTSMVGGMDAWRAAGYPIEQ
ncbi:MAG: rhodanese-like domain-containing protein [Blastocatellia bacterium]|nr:rhodanese-like domain-containing protein [Blastocatellia bacterium]